MKLIPKERFNLTVNHKDVDRPVIDFQSASEIIGSLINYFQAENYGELINRLQVDVRGIEPDYIGPALKTFPDGTKEDIFGVRRKEIDSTTGKTTAEVYHPLAAMNTIDDFRKGYSFPSYKYFNFEVIKEKVNEHKKYALNTGWMSIWYLYFFLRKMDQVLVDMLLNKEFFHYVMQAITDYWKCHVKRILEKAGGSIDYVMTYEDFGTTGGLLISLDDIRNNVLIYYKDFAKFLSNYGARFAFHSCGSIQPVIPDLLKLGVSILDPVQVSAKGMGIGFLKNKYGDKLTFRGAIDTTKLLPKGTAGEIKEKVKSTIKILGQNGGYIFCSSNTINADVPLENVLAMYEAALGDKFWKK